MIIGIDGHEANQMQRTGVGWCVFHLLGEFQKQATSALQFKIFLQSQALADLPKPTKYFQYFVVPKRTMWSQIDLPIALYTGSHKLNVFFSPAHYAPRFCPCPTIVLVHDLSYFYYPQDFLKKDLYQLVEWTKYSVKQAAKVVAVSALTKHDLIENYNLSSSKITVIPNGFAEPKLNQYKTSIIPQKPYFLYIGTLQPRKNIPNLILAFERFLSSNPEYTLYLVGKRGWMFSSILKLIEKKKLGQRVQFLDYLPEEEKWTYLKNATALILPGFYEGFGLPVLEAFTVSTPVLASKWGALPEVARDGALYFEPNLVMNIYDTLQKITNQTERQKLVAKGHQVLKSYSWQKSAALFVTEFQKFAPHNQKELQ